MDTKTGRALAFRLSMLALWLSAMQALAAGELAPARIPAAEIPWPDASARVEGTGMRPVFRS